VRPKQLDDLTATALYPTEDLAGWRRRQLEGSGFEPRLALILAASRVDLHALIGLVEYGCPPHLAARILAPLEAGEGWC
jgi:hypothetical protein